MIDFMAEPIFVALSRVASIMVAIIAVVFSKLIPTDAAEEAVLLIAVASSCVSEAVTFCVPSKSLIYLRSLMNCFMFP